MLRSTVVGPMLSALLLSIAFFPARAAAEPLPDAPAVQGKMASTASTTDSAESASSDTAQFNGSFHELGARLSWQSIGSLDSTGPGVDVGVRHAFPMFLGDMRLAWGYAEPASPMDKYAQHTLSAHVGVHPLYLFLLGNDTKSFTLASLAVEAGLGAKYSRREASVATATEQTATGLLWSLGVSFDVPLGNPNRGRAPWLSAAWHYQSAPLPLGSGTERRGQQNFALGLAWRWNGLLF